MNLVQTFTALMASTCLLCAADTPSPDAGSPVEKGGWASKTPAEREAMMSQRRDEDKQMFSKLETAIQNIFSAMGIGHSSFDTSKMETAGDHKGLREERTNWLSKIEGELKELLAKIKESKGISNVSASAEPPVAEPKAALDAPPATDKPEGTSEGGPRRQFRPEVRDADLESFGKLENLIQQIYTVLGMGFTFFDTSAMKAADSWPVLREQRSAWVNKLESNLSEIAGKVK